MARLILDKMRRLIGAWLFICLLSLLVGWMLGEMISKPKGRDLSDFNVFMFLFGLASLPGWLMELKSGYHRVALTLPFTTRQMGRFFWSIGVGMPTFLIACFGGLGLLTHGVGPGFFRSWVELTLVMGLLLGSIFWIFSGSPRPTADKGEGNRRMQRVYVFIFFAVILAFLYWLLHASFSRDTKVAIFSVPALAFTILGWSRAEGFLIDCGGWRETGIDEGKKAGTIQAPSGRGGLTYLSGKFALEHLMAMLLAVVGIIIFNLWESHGQNWSHLPWAWCCMLYGSLIVTLRQLNAIVTQLRCVRTLPLSGGQIAVLLLLVVLTPFLITVLIVSLLIGMSAGHPAGMLAGKVGVMGLAPLSVLAVGMVWNSEYRWGRLILIAMATFFAGAVPFYHLVLGGPSFSVMFAGGYASVFAVLAASLIQRLVERHDFTYRQRGATDWNNE